MPLSRLLTVIASIHTHARVSRALSPSDLRTRAAFQGAYDAFATPLFFSLTSQAPARTSDLEIPPRAARSFRHHDAFLRAYILDLAVWYAQAGLRGASANFGSISKLRYERVIFHVIDSFFGALAFQGHCVSRNCEHARSVLGVSVAGHPATLLSMH